MDRQIRGIHGSATCRHQSAGAVSGRCDHGVTDIHGRSVAIGENRVGMCTVRIHHDIGKRKCRSVRCENRGIVSVKICLVTGIRIAGLRHF